MTLNQNNGYYVTSASFGLDERNDVKHNAFDWRHMSEMWKRTRVRCARARPEIEENSS